MLASQAEARVLLDVPFRGDRDYVHSTDLFASLNDLAQQFLGLDAYLKTLVLRRRARRQVTAQFRPDATAFGTFTFTARDRIMEGWLVESQMAINRRIVFHEAPIARKATSQEGRVALRSPVPGYSAIEQLIVLLKILCAQCHSGAWLFTSIDLDGPLSQQAALSVTRTQMVLSRMIEASLYQGGHLAGRSQMVLPAAGGIP
jgi:hypothetical protein